MCPQRISLGITGGIGSGKSYVCRMLRAHGVPVFYCDPEARLEMQSNPDLRAELQALVGSHVYGADGEINKPLLRAFMMQAPEHVARVNAIVHPRVLQRLERWVAARHEPVVATECALLFEAGFERAVSLSVLVSAPRAVRLERVMQRDGVNRATALKWMSWQMSQKAKRRLSDVEIVNDGVAPLEPQIEQLLKKATDLARQGGC